MKKYVKCNAEIDYKIKDYLADWAKDQVKSSEPVTSFRDFKEQLKNDGIEANQNRYDYYLECYNNAKQGNIKGCNDSKYVKAATSDIDVEAMKEELIAAFEEMDADDVADLWNSAVGIDNDREIYKVADIDDRFREWKPSDLIELARAWDRFEFTDTYFTFDDGSFWDLIGGPWFDEDELADAIIAEKDSFGHDEIEEILAKFID